MARLVRVALLRRGAERIRGRGRRIRRDMTNGPASLLLPTAACTAAQRRGGRSVQLVRCATLQSAGLLILPRQPAVLAISAAARPTARRHPARLKEPVAPWSWRTFAAVRSRWQLSLKPSTLSERLAEECCGQWSWRGGSCSIELPPPDTSSHLNSVSLSCHQQTPLTL